MRQFKKFDYPRTGEESTEKRTDKYRQEKNQKPDIQGVLEAVQTLQKDNLAKRYKQEGGQ